MTRLPVSHMDIIDLLAIELVRDFGEEKAFQMTTGAARDAVLVCIASARRSESPSPNPQIALSGSYG